MTELRVADEPVGTLAGGQVERADGASADVHPIVEVVRSPTGSGRRAGSRRARPGTTEMRQRLQHVLAGQSFPAERWELIVTADMYGADLVTRNELHALAPVRFESLAEVLLAVEHIRRACRWLEQ
jgi:hypothetical protein